MRKRGRPARAAWEREDEPDLAVERILQAAEKAFVEVGVSGAGMEVIAATAGCSRGTLYRYFPTRHDLHLAYMKRTALEIQRSLQEAVASIADPRERLVAYILGAVRAVRTNPATAAWFEPGVAGVTTRMSRSGEVVEALTAAFVRAFPEPNRSSTENALRRRWIMRVVVSLLSDPAASAAEERTLVERYVVPALLVESTSRRRAVPD
jgi:AcrR family transcriptional regulator